MQEDKPEATDSDLWLDQADPHLKELMMTAHKTACACKQKMIQIQAHRKQLASLEAELEDLECALQTASDKLTHAIKQEAFPDWDKAANAI